MVVVGNKIDLSEQETVSLEETVSFDEGETFCQVF